MSTVLAKPDEPEDDNRQDALRRNDPQEEGKLSRPERREATQWVQGDYDGGEAGGDEAVLRERLSGSIDAMPGAGIEGGGVSVPEGSPGAVDLVSVLSLVAALVSLMLFVPAVSLPAVPIALVAGSIGLVRTSAADPGGPRRRAGRVLAVAGLAVSGAVTLLWLTLIFGGGALLGHWMT